MSIVTAAYERRELGHSLMLDMRGLACPSNPLALMLAKSFKNRAGIELLPAYDFDVGKIDLPKFGVNPSFLIFEFVRRFKHDDGRVADQIMRLECAIRSGFRDKIAFSVRQSYRRLAR